MTAVGRTFDPYGVSLFARAGAGVRSDQSMKKLQIRGTGCPKCKKLAENTEAAAQALGIEYELVKVTDINEIMKFGVMITPAVAVDDEVKVVGKVPGPEAIKPMLS